MSPVRTKCTIAHQVSRTQLVHFALLMHPTYPPKEASLRKPQSAMQSIAAK